MDSASDTDLKGWNIQVLTFVIGVLGSWYPFNSTSLAKLAITGTVVEELAFNCGLSAVNSSASVWKYFIGNAENSSQYHRIVFDKPLATCSNRMYSIKTTRDKFNFNKWSIKQQFGKHQTTDSSIRFIMKITLHWFLTDVPRISAIGAHNSHKEAFGPKPKWMFYLDRNEFFVFVVVCCCLYLYLSILSYLTHVGIGMANKMTRMPYIARRLQLDIEITPNTNIRANLEMTLIMEIWRAIAKPALKFMQQETNQEKQNWQNEILQGNQLNPEEKQNLQELWEEEAKSWEINQRKLREKLKPIVNARATWTSMASKETERDNQRIAVINQPLRLNPNDQPAIGSESDRELTLQTIRQAPQIEQIPSTSAQQGEETENVITLDVMDKEFTDGSSSYISANEEAKIPSLKSKIIKVFKKTTKRPETALGNSQSSVEERRSKQRKKEKAEKLKISSFEKVTHTDLDVPVPYAYKSIRIAAQASVTHNDGQIPTHITYKGVKWPIEALVIGDPEGSIARRMIWHLPTFRDERYLRGGEM